MQLFPIFLAQAGCPQRCIFCSRQQVGAGAAPLDPYQVAAQLKERLPRFGTGEVAFFGGSFTALAVPLQEAYLGAVGPFLAAGRIAGIRLSTRPDCVDDRVARRLAAAGVRTVELGCQSFSENVLLASGRGHDSTAAGRAVAALRSAGLAVGLQLMPGLPEGDCAEARVSLAAALSLSPDFLRIYPTVVFPGSRLAESWRQGKFHPLTLDAAVDLCADLLWTCRAAGGPVIRLGLQGDADLDRGCGILAGPYHPAFGQLVRSRLWRRALQRLSTLSLEGTVDVPRRELSDAIGHRRANLEYFAGLEPPLTLQDDPGLAPGTLRRGRTIFSLLQLAGEYERGLSDTH